MGRRANLIISASFMLIGLVYFIYGRTYSWGKLDEPGPGLLPAVSGVLMIILALSLFLSYFFRRKDIAFENQEGGGNYKKPALMTALTIAYLFALMWFGYFISTFLFLLAGIKIIRPQNWVKPITVSMVIVVFSYLLFVYVLKLQVPGL